MHFFTGKYPGWLCRSFTLVVYAAFFLVQLSCINGPDSVTVISTLSFHKAKQNAVDNQQDHVKKTKLNITKRFHPAGGDILLPSLTGIPVPYNCIVYTMKSEPDQFFSFILTTSLRGPPAIA
jgi:hypothetical protein